MPDQTLTTEQISHIKNALNALLILQNDNISTYYAKEVAFDLMAKLAGAGMEIEFKAVA